MADNNSNSMTKPQKPAKPRADFPLFPHASGQWAKKIKGKMEYFGAWNDPAAAEVRYLARVAESPIIPEPPKSAKPYPDFPLSPHPNGQWCKKIRGRLHYFGPMEDWKAALELYREQKDDLQAGRKPQPKGGLTVSQLVSLFIHDRKQAAARGKIQERTVADYEAAIKRMLKSIQPERLVSDLRPIDFANLLAHLAKTRGAYSIYGDVTRMRTLFNFGDQNCHVRPDYGTAFQKPSKLELRRARRKRGKKMFSRRQIRKLLRAASVPLRAMIYLGINCGFGNEDCATLTFDELDLKRGWHCHGRPKTEAPRRCPLWPQTVAAISAAVAARPKPRDEQYNNLVFITSRGTSWTKTYHDNPLSKEMGKLLDDLGFHRKGVNFYALRHTFQTVAEECDGVATHFIMGHMPGNDDMAAVYRERMTRARLKRVAQYVRKWLFTKKPPARPEESSRSSPGSPAQQASTVAESVAAAPPPEAA